MVRVRLRRLQFTAAALFATLAAWLPPEGRGGEPEKLIPASFTTKSDALGFRWDINQTGVVSDGTNDCFDGGLFLKVNGVQFSAARSMMTPDGREYVLSGTPAGIKVTRRILVDTVRSAVRYIEVFENPGGNAVTLTVTIRSMLGGSCASVVTSTGAGFTGSLGKKDIGLLTTSRQGRRPCVMFLVSGSRGKVKPRISNQSNRTFEFIYSIKVEPKKTVSLLHVVAQRHLSSVSDPGKVFSAFYKKNKLIGLRVPKALRSGVVNFHVSQLTPSEWGKPGASFRFVLEMAEAMNVKRGEADVLVLDEETRLSGTASCDSLTIETARGKVAVPLADLALLRGSRGAGRRCFVYLRNGEILAGSVRAEALKLVPSGAEGTEAASGLTIKMLPESVDMLFTRRDERDGIPLPGTVAFLRTRSGECLALSGETSLTFEAATAWGMRRVPFDQLERMLHVRKPEPLHRISLTDGSRLAIVLCGGKLLFETLRFGPLEVDPREVASLIRVRLVPRSPPRPFDTAEWPEEVRGKLGEAVDLDVKDAPLAEVIAKLQEAAGTAMAIDLDDPEVDVAPLTLKLAGTKLEKVLKQILAKTNLRAEFRDGRIVLCPPERILVEDPVEEPKAKLDVAHCLLAGENIAVGAPDVPHLRVVTTAGLVLVDPAQIRVMERAEAKDVEDADSRPPFSLELRSGRKLKGRLEERLLPIRSGRRLWQVPVRHLLSFRGGPDPPKSEKSEKKESEEKPEADGGEETGTKGDGQVPPTVLVLPSPLPTALPPPTFLWTVTAPATPPPPLLPPPATPTLLPPPPTP